MKRKVLEADTPEHKGPCLPTWLASPVANRLSGRVTGFFKPAKCTFGIWHKYGKEFHGVIREIDGEFVVKTTEGIY